MHLWRSIGRLAWRESRTARRRLLLSMSSISLGVGALVAIDSFAANLTSSLREQSRALLGGDIAFAARRPFTPAADSLFDSLAKSGVRLARSTNFPSMAVVQRTGNTRLVQIRAVSAEYPLYGEITTEPAGNWSQLQTGAHALIDPSLLVALDTRVGDTITVGYARFLIAGTVKDVPGTPGIAEMIGPRVFIPARYLPETQLLQFGSTAGYEVLGKTRTPAIAEQVSRAVRPRRRALDINVRTAEQAEDNVSEAIGELAQFIGVVGLVALLLGGLGVASGVHAFVARKIDTVAILRCLGATSRQVLAVYVLQAAAMGVLGAAMGVALGVGMQFLVPIALSDVLPVDVSVRPELSAMIAGLLVGAWVALAFALRPLVALRKISPLQTLRRDADSQVLRVHWRDIPRLMVNVAIAASVVTIAVLRTGSLTDGIGMSIGAGLALALLAASAGALAWLARKGVRPRWPYVLRQGLSNLHRPANQTRPVILALGFGAFLVTTLYVVQSSLLERFSLGVGSSSANVVFFDVQQDQSEGVDSIVRAGAQRVVQQAPVVVMRVSSINGVAATDDRIEQTPDGPRARWALRREYRSTFRDTLVSSERLISGRWDAATRAASDTSAISVEQDLARDLKLKLGDVITWDVQGVPVTTRITSLRSVNWNRFEPNFFIVFRPEALAAAPIQYIMTARTADGAQTARLQRAVVSRFPNVSSIDLSLIQSTIGKILERVTVAVRFLALFSLAMAVPVLISAVAGSRRDRVREGVLLKTLGATRAQVARIMLAEYAALGVLGSATGLLLAYVAGWAITRFVFDTEFTPAIGPSLGIAGLMIGMTVTIGLLAGREVFRETAMTALRSD
ncbi:MAG TPA: FtsX-like permease family protein [Gemmatimonadaceae bacterium]|nr:FtsX-like permease family protein [Gemmatimonadaceae bacterium]